MNIHFSIHYHTQWGEALSVTTLFYDSEAEKPVARQETNLKSDDGQTWYGVLHTDIKFQQIRYSYSVFFHDQPARTEKQGHILNWHGADSSAEHFLFDCWHDTENDRYLHTDALERCIYAPRPSQEEHSASTDRTVEFTTGAVLPANRILGLCGNIPALGCWNPDSCLKMTRISAFRWSVRIDADKLKECFSYKFIVLDADNSQLTQWESGPDRTFSIPLAHYPSTYYIKKEENPVRIPTSLWHGAGVVIPLFSLRSNQSYGVGDFGDLHTLIDWASSVKMSAIQLLPINDTTQSHTWKDSYPYNSVSVFALHPMYLDLSSLGKLRDVRLREKFERTRQEINILPQVDYERVNRLKRDYISCYFRASGRRELKSQAYRHFLDRSKHWLLPYALFSYLRDLYHTADFRLWPDKWQVYDSDKAKQFIDTDKEASEQTAFYCYLQFKLHEQMCAVHRHAREKGIILKGDIPIGISRNSVPAWVDPHYFHFNSQAGAPPDDFSVDGQNWGFPTYNWPTMLKDNCSWWKQRLTQMAEYFDAYRIDHVLGFFRIWEIPQDYISGLMGHFAPAIPLSIEEIEAHGLVFDKKRLTSPHISTDYLNKLFGHSSSYVADTFLQRIAPEQWAFKPEYGTQRKLLSYFSANPKDADLYEPLCTLLFNRLLIEDPYSPGYHPRISAQKTEAFQALSANEQHIYNCIYNDFFYQRHNQYWYDEAMKKLPHVIEATQMLACAEDLGMIPESVKWALNELQILSLEIQRMPKEYGVRFGNPTRYPYLSVATIATHDMPPIRLWWERADSDTRREFFRHVLGKDGEPPAELSASLCEKNIRQHLESPSMLCLIALQDWLAISPALMAKDPQTEQINEPTNPDQYWRYRMHITLEELIVHSDFNEKIRNTIVQTHRDKDEHDTVL